MNAYLTFKALHLIAVISWMAGLLYLPRIFVYHAETKENNEQSQKDAQQAKEEIPRRLNEYKSVLEPLDAQIVQINDQINTELAKIPQAVTDAVGHGCSIVSAGHGNGILYIGGEPVGMGSTVFTDLAMIEDYGNIDKAAANNPFGDDKLINLTNSTIARGVKNRNFNSVQ